jgi:hypothetical protein
MKKRFIKKEWEAHIQDFKESGLSKAAWCQKQNLPVHRLYYWLRNYHLKLIVQLKVNVQNGYL